MAYVVEPPVPAEGLGPSIPMPVQIQYLELGIQGSTGVPSWPENYQEQVRLYTGAGSTVFLMGPFPLFRPDLPNGG
jgi:hypothetical protein